ncbi:MAG: LysR family transcriptional regulator [Pseudomonadota bacterium]
MRDLNDMALFALLVEAGSFTAAAGRAGLPKSTVSRRLARLEERLGVRLIERSTRRLRVTEAGEVYRAHCQRILEEADRAEQTVQDLIDAPRGPLRLTASVAVGQCLLAPLLGPFLARYPDVDVHLELTNRRVDLLAEAFDLALRIGPLEDTRLVARNLSDTRLRLCASPAYLDRAGVPETPADLARHTTLAMRDAALRADRWTLVGPDGVARLSLRPRVAVNDFLVLHQLALAGQGIACLPDFVGREDLAAGRLMAVLPAWTGVDKPLSALYPSARGVTPKLRVLLEYLAATLPQRF